MFFKYFFIIFFLFLFLLPTSVFAIENPLDRPNNKVGIHILAPSELDKAAELINTNGGDWGYITIPIPSGDKNLGKWQTFMDHCRSKHIIPILRLATGGDYYNTAVWRKPTQEDIIYFATFLDNLRWPTKNRYIIVFNEVNRGNEWGGEVNPEEYAKLLQFAVTMFKSKSSDYFIISAGLDNAAPNQGMTYMDQYDYLKAMNVALPGIFNQIDGISSHSYPNPAFAQPPSRDSLTGVASFHYEQELINNISGKKLPVFITETGWSTKQVSDENITHYYEQTFATIWNDDSIVAVTPFLLEALEGPFQQFSLIDPDGKQNSAYETIKSLPKTKGFPYLSVNNVLAAEVAKPQQKKQQTTQQNNSPLNNLLAWIEQIL
jgi:hypothetical protein